MDMLQDTAEKCSVLLTNNTRTTQNDLGVKGNIYLSLNYSYSHFYKMLNSLVKTLFCPQ